MIKEFFAKLMSWNSEQNKAWKKSTAQQFISESQRETNLAKERAERHRQNMRVDAKIPQIDTNRPSDSSENHDQAA